MFSNFYYKRKLKAYIAAQNVNRCFLNLNSVKHMLVAMECEDVTQLRAIEKEIKPLLAKVPKVTYLIFLNMKKMDEFSYVTTSQDRLLFKNNLVRKYTPNADTVKEIAELKPDVFVNLNKNASRVIDFFTAVSTAKMRVGFPEKLDVTELQIGAKKADDYQTFFKKLLQFMGQINAKVA